MMRDDPGTGDYELYEEFAANYGYANTLLPFLQSHFKPCSSSPDSSDDVGNCRPFYMPCKSELACAISCRVNDYSCGKCSETNSFRKVCQCCDSDKSSTSIKRNNVLLSGLTGLLGGGRHHSSSSSSGSKNKKQSDGKMAKRHILPPGFGK